MSSLINKDMGFGPYSITELSHSTVTLGDGIKLAMKVWLPCSKEQIAQNFPYFATDDQMKWATELHLGIKSPSADETFPTIMEYLPYSKDTPMTLERDHARHTWFCSHGYVDVRIDLRGTGQSEGLYYDEYDEQEFKDCIEVIEWISSQSWSNKRVGMYGKSWGGFNGLQVAYKQPEALKTIISLYSTDNRYTDDIHHEGDTIIGNGLLSWAGYMMALNARPPHPRYFDSIDAWKKFWLNRLENAGQSFLCTWLHHQHPHDPYWQHGSIWSNAAQIECPVLVIGGHTDSYTNAAFRMAGTLNKYSRSIIGPWSHQWPDVSIPGPNIDYLGTCLKWWDAYLKDDSSQRQEVTRWPRLRLFVRDPVKPENIATSTDGRWFDIRSWDARLHSYLNSSQIAETAGFTNHIYLGPNRKLFFEPSVNVAEPVELGPNPKQGSASGAWLAIDQGFPKDQTITDQHSFCWISNVLDEDIIFAGLSKMFVCLEARTSGRYSIHIRVCDLFPSGESFLVTRGFQNLSSFEDGWVSDFPGNVKQTKCVNLKGVGHTVKKGHKLLVSITPSYFPLVFPAVNNNGLVIHPSETYLVLQTLNSDVEMKSSAFSEPKPLLMLPVHQITPSLYDVKEKYEDEKWVQELHDNSGIRKFPSMNFEYEERIFESYSTDNSVSHGDITATQSIETTYDHDEGGKWKTVVQTSQEMIGNKQCFRIKETLKVTVNNEEFFTKKWDNIVPRKYV